MTKNNQTTANYWQLALITSVCLAAAIASLDVSADVFDNVNTKGSEIVVGLKKIAIVVATIAIMIVAFMMYKGRIGNQMAFGVIVGSIVLGAAPEVADLLIN